MITLLKNVALRSHLLWKPSFYFANKSNVEFHKAVIASQIITTIRDSPLNEYQSKNFSSLRESILEGINKYETKNNDSPDKKLIEQAAKEVRNCFEDGVYVPLYMCNQNRNHEQIISYSNLKEQNGQIQILNYEKMEPSELKDLEFRKLKFCPTYVITGQIFRRIFKLLDYSLITGQYGVGKTYSLILYTLLSETIFRYKHEHCSEKDDLPTQIDFKIPKSVYLSINNSQKLQDQQSYRNNLAQIFQWQCYQLKNLWKNRNIFTLKLNEFRRQYSKLGMQIQFQQDQINEPAAAFRKYKVLEKLMEKLLLQQISIEKMETQNLQNQMQLKRLRTKQTVVLEKIQILSKLIKSANFSLKKAIYFRDALNQLIGNGSFNSILYLSSVDIEKNFLVQLKLMGQSKQDSITSRMVRLQYPMSLFGSVAIADTCEMIILNLKSHWQKLQIPKQKDEKNKLQKQQQIVIQKIQKLLNVIMRENQYLLILPLTVNQFFTNQQQSPNNQNKNKNQKQQAESSNSQASSKDRQIINEFLKELSYQKIKQYDQSQFKKTMHELVQKLQQSSIQAIKIQFQEFLEKKTGNQIIDNLKLKLSFRLFILSEKILKNMEKQQQAEKETNDINKLRRIKDLNQFSPVSIEDLKQLFENPEISQAITQTLFSVKYSLLHARINPIVIQKVFQAKKALYNQLLLAQSNTLFNMNKNNRKALGIFLKSSMIEMLQKGGTSFSIIRRSNDMKKLKQFNQIHQLASCFMPIPDINMQNYNDYHFLKSFYTHFQTIQKGKAYQKRKTTWNVLLPLEQRFQNSIPQILQLGVKQYQIDYQSKLIDFALCRQIDKTLQIHTFKVKIKQNQEQLMETIEDFLVDFLNFKDKSKTSIAINEKKLHISLHYSVIAFESFNQDYQKYFFSRIKELQSKINPEPKDLKKLSALKQFIFKNNEDVCQVKGVNENIFLETFSVLSLGQVEFCFKNSNSQKSLSPEQQIFERVMKELKAKKSSRGLKLDKK